MAEVPTTELRVGVGHSWMIVPFAAVGTHLRMAVGHPFGRAFKVALLGALALSGEVTATHSERRPPTATRSEVRTTTKWAIGGPFSPTRGYWNRKTEWSQHIPDTGPFE